MRPRSAYFNYRVCMHRLSTGEQEFDLREVYYDSTDRPVSFSKDPVHPTGETKDELLADVSRMATCIGTAVIDLDELEKELKMSDVG